MVIVYHMKMSLDSDKLSPGVFSHVLTKLIFEGAKKVKQEKTICLCGGLKIFLSSPQL